MKPSLSFAVLLYHASHIIVNYILLKLPLKFYGNRMKGSKRNAEGHSGVRKSRKLLVGAARFSSTTIYLIVIPPQNGPKGADLFPHDCVALQSA